MGEREFVELAVKNVRVPRKGYTDVRRLYDGDTFRQTRR